MDAYLRCGARARVWLALVRLRDKHPTDTLCKTQGDETMPAPATYSRSGPIGHIVMNDGKANVMSVAVTASA